MYRRNYSSIYSKKQNYLIYSNRMFYTAPKKHCSATDYEKWNMDTKLNKLYFYGLDRIVVDIISLALFKICRKTNQFDGLILFWNKGVSRLPKHK